MANYAKQLPLDKNNYPYPAPPAFTSKQDTKGVPLASSVITLSPDTTVIEITALGGQAGNAIILGKWGTASVTASNYDIMIPSGTVRDFVVPVSQMGTPQASMAGANAANGLYNSLAVIVGTAVSASIFTAEY